MPQPEHVREGLAAIPLRLHSDIVLSSQMLVEPKEVVYLLPAHTRYEQKDGATETSTERRIIFSPEIPGHQIGEARSEWQILVDLAHAVRGAEADALGLNSGPEIREEIARAVPFYEGIQHLEKQGDQLQWGGPHLCARRRFGFPDHRARFAAVRPPLREGLDQTFLLATRRGKQFNSMVQARRDPLTGADRDHILIAHADAERLGLVRDQKLVLVSDSGRLEARAFPTECAPGSLQGHWPEVNVLLPNDRVDPEGGVPDYNARVRIEIPV